MRHNVISNIFESKSVPSLSALNFNLVALHLLGLNSTSKLNSSPAGAMSYYFLVLFLHFAAVGRVNT